MGFWSATRDRLRGLRDCFRGWGKRDAVRVFAKLDDPECWNGGIIKLTMRECRALCAANRQIAATEIDAFSSPMRVWVEGRGLRVMVTMIRPSRPSPPAAR
jgi:hypothetical protein